MSPFIWLRHLLVAFSLLELFITSQARSQAGHSIALSEDATHYGASNLPRWSSAEPELKVLCIGDSITIGMADGNAVGENNGYRLDLYNLLTNAGMIIQFIGTQTSGLDNPQPRMEGYGWQTIDSILSKIENNRILSEQPNLILIHAGTNDDDLPQTSNDASIIYANAPNRLGTLIDYVLCQAPSAVVLVAKLIQNKYNQTSTDAFNEQVPVVVDQRYAKGYKVRVVDMSMIGGDELFDALHPVAAGYTDMANRWYAAISDIPGSWWSTNTLSEDQPVVCASASMPDISRKSTNTGGQTVMQDALGMQFTLPLGMTIATTTSGPTSESTPSITTLAIGSASVTNSLTGMTAPMPPFTPGISASVTITALPLHAASLGNKIVMPCCYTSLVLVLIFYISHLYQ